MEIQIRYTTAPACYDGFGTAEDGTAGVLAGFIEVGGSKKPVRRVAIPHEAFSGNWQEGRYDSGMHCTVDEAGWRKLLRLGMAEEATPAQRALAMLEMEYSSEVKRRGTFAHALACVLLGRPEEADDPPTARCRFCAGDERATACECT